MGYFPVRYDSRVIIYERKMFIRLATGLSIFQRCTGADVIIFIYAEIKHSDWLFQVTLLFLTNQSVSFRCRVATLL